MHLKKHKTTNFVLIASDYTILKNHPFFLHCHKNNAPDMYVHFSFVGGMEKIKQHTFALAHYTYTVLSNLRYANGAPVVRIYSDTDFSNPDVQGPIINFNVLDENGEVLGFSQVCFSLGLT